MNSLFSPIINFVSLGGPVIALILIVSVFALTLLLYKIWHLWSVKVGRHGEINSIVSAWDSGHHLDAVNAMLGSTHYLIPVLKLGAEIYGAPNALQRLEAEATARLIKLESGLRALDIIAQLAPLLGLFGTVLGMIEAFRALQGAGANVDPSVLAGGIWVALMTTAAGLAVAMPTSVALTWLESRLDAERSFAETSIAAIISPSSPAAAISTHHVS